MNNKAGGYMKGLIIVGDLFEDVEFIAPLDVWRRNKDDIVVASMMKRKTVISKLGIEMTVDALIEEVNLEEFDFLFIPGGPGAFKILNTLPKVNEIINYFANSHKLVTAICAAPMLIGRLGYLKDKNYTVHPGFEDQIIEGNYLRDKGVVKDQNFITGKSMYYAIDLALEVVRFFYGDKHTQILLESLQGEMK